MLRICFSLAAHITGRLSAYNENMSASSKPLTTLYGSTRGVLAAFGSHQNARALRIGLWSSISFGVLFIAFKLISEEKCSLRMLREAEDVFKLYWLPVGVPAMSCYMF